MRLSLGFIAFVPVALLAQTQIDGGETKTDTTWSKSRSPYLIRGRHIVYGATLTVEPGTVVMFAKDAELVVGLRANAKLIAEGSANARIRFVPEEKDTGAGFWKGIEITGAGTSAQLKYVDISGAGADTPSAPSYRFALRIGPDASANLDWVTIERSTRGVEFDTDAPISMSNCTVQDCSSEAISASQQVAAAIESSNTVKRNGINAIIIGEAGQPNFAKSAIWSNTTTPYLIRGDLLVEGPVPGISLTLSPGVTILFDEESAITVGWDQRADLIANGTEDKPIVFDAWRGKWDGIYLGLSTPRTSFNHCFFRRGGVTQAMLIAEENSEGFVRNSRFEASENYGVALPKVSKVRYEGLSFSGNRAGDVHRF